MSVKIRMHLEGAQNLTSVFRKLPLSARKYVKQAIRETTAAVERSARMRAPVSSGGRASRKGKRRPGPGELRDTIRSEFVEDAEGIVGFVKAGRGKLKRRLKGLTSTRKSSLKRAKKIEKNRKAANTRRRKQMGPLTADQANIGAYAMVVEYGDKRRGRAAQPFMRPALESQRQPHRQRMERAVNQAVAEAQNQLGKVG